MNDYKKMFQKFKTLFQEFKTLGLSRYLEELRTLFHHALTGEKYTPQLLPVQYLPGDLMEGQFFSPALKQYFLSIQEEGAPYSGFMDNPDAIIQIKSMLNALYHAHMAVRGLENIGISTINSILTIADHSYQAGYLFTHIDMRVFSAFIPEKNIVFQWIAWFKEKCDALTQHEASKNIKAYLTAYQAGKISGISIEQLSSHQKIDFTFLMELFAKAPQFIDTLRQRIEKYSALDRMTDTDERPAEILELQTSIQELFADFAAIEPSITANKIQEFQEDAFKIIYGLEDLYYGSRFLIPFKILRYIRLLRRIISISRSIIEQVNFANEASQEAIVQKLVALKYGQLLELFALADKIENYGMLRPGLVSRPLMQIMDKLYGFLLGYVEKVVNFSHYGEDLRILNDNVFASRRIETIQRVQLKQKTRRIAEVRTQQAFKNFFSIVEKYRTIEKIPREKFEELKHIYPQIQKLFYKYNKTIHSGMVKILKAQPDRDGWLKGLSDRLKESLGFDKSQEYWKNLKTDLEQILKSRMNSIKFRTSIESALMEAIPSGTLSPYRQTFSVFAVNEREFLALADDLPVTEKHSSIVLDQDKFEPELWISSRQAHFLKNIFREKNHSAQKAHTAYKNFYHVCKQAGKKTPGQKTQLLQWYREFQAWLYVQKNMRLDFDQKIVTELALDEMETSDNISELLEKYFDFETCLQGYRDFYQEREIFWLEFANNQTKSEKKSILLWPAETKQNYESRVFPQGNANKIAAYARSTYKLHTLLNAAVQMNLRFNALNHPENSEIETRDTITELPYPEMGDARACAEPKQTAAIKCFHNALHHIQCMLAYLEKLDNNSKQYDYMYHLLRGFQHAFDAYKLLGGLYTDPYYRLLARKLHCKMREYYSFLQPEIQEYMHNSAAIPGTDGAVQYSVLWYAMNALVLLPAHVQARSMAKLNPDLLHKMAKQYVIDIERVINSTVSIPKMLLEVLKKIPLPFRLYSRINIFRTHVYSFCMKNLENLDGKVFFALVQKVDEWEQVLGLRPGLLSEILESHLQSFYTGLLEASTLSFDQKFTGIFNTRRTENRRIACSLEQESITKQRLQRPECEKEIIELYERLSTCRSGESDTAIARLYAKYFAFLQEQNNLLFFKKDMVKLYAMLEKYLAVKPECSELERNISLLLDIHVQTLERQAALWAQEEKPLFLMQTNADAKIQEVLQKILENAQNRLMSFRATLPLASLLRYMSATYARELLGYTCDAEKQEILDVLVSNKELRLQNSYALLRYLAMMYKQKETSVRLQWENADTHYQYFVKERSRQTTQMPEKQMEWIEKEIRGQIALQAEKFYRTKYVKRRYIILLQNYFTDTMRKQKIAQQIFEQKDLSELIEEENANFVHENYPLYAHTDQILLTLNFLKQYLNKEENLCQNEKSIHENSDTIKIKQAFVKNCRKIIKNPNESFEMRLVKLKNEIRIYKIRFKYSNVRLEHYNWLWFKQWCLYFLSLVGLYKSSIQKHYEKLATIAQQKTDSFSLPRQHGFFKKNPVSAEPPMPVERLFVQT